MGLATLNKAPLSRSELGWAMKMVKMMDVDELRRIRDRAVKLQTVDISRFPPSDLPDFVHLRDHRLANEMLHRETLALVERLAIAMIAGSPAPSGRNDKA